MNPSPSEAESLRLIGGVLCLDFANTLNGHSQPAARHEYLKDYSDLLLWCRRTGILPVQEAAILLEEAADRPKKASAAYRDVIAYRETLYRIFSAIAQGQPVKAADLAQLNETRSDALAHSQLIPSSVGPEGFVLDLTNKKSLHRMLWPLALSAAELLTSARPGQIRQCAGQGCDWLFLDTSRNHLRKWCSMDECGNRSKSRRFFERSRKLAIEN
jgi:predicted RNA-binding Zn ribbon-like protein